MKQIAAVCLLVIYSFNAVGATIHVHYCMNKVTCWDLSLGKARNCETCGMTKAKSKGCCRDEFKCIQVKSEHQLPAITVPAPAFTMIAVVYPRSAYSFSDPSVVRETSPIGHAPPISPLRRLHMLYCVYVI
jgi:hypothetical protein